MGLLPIIWHLALLLGVEKKRIGWGTRIALLAILLIVIFFAMAVFDHGRYGFLYKYHPDRFDMLSGSVLVNVRLIPATDPPPKEYCLCFSKADAAAVLADLKKELNPDRGYTCEDAMKTKPWIWMFGSKKDEVWTFLSSPTEGAVFANGVFGASYRGTAQTEGSGKVFTASGWGDACVVVIVHNESSFERFRRSVRTFLHLE